MEKVKVKLKCDYTIYGIPRKAGEIIGGVYSHVAKRNPKVFEIINENTERESNPETTISEDAENNDSE